MVLDTEDHECAIRRLGHLFVQSQDGKRRGSGGQDYGSRQRYGRIFYVEFCCFESATFTLLSFPDNWSGEISRKKTLCELSN